MMNWCQDCQGILDKINQNFEITWQVTDFPLDLLKFTHSKLLRVDEKLEDRYENGQFDKDLFHEVTIRSEDGIYMFYHFMRDDCHGESQHDECQELTENQIKQLISFYYDKNCPLTSEPYEFVYE